LQQQQQHVATAQAHRQQVSEAEPLQEHQVTWKQEEQIPPRLLTCTQIQFPPSLAKRQNEPRGWGSFIEMTPNFSMPHSTNFACSTKPALKGDDVCPTSSAFTSLVTLLPITLFDYRDNVTDPQIPSGINEQGNAPSPTHFPAGNSYTTSTISTSQDKLKNGRLVQPLSADLYER
jgi:hypothetical protein